MALVEFGACTVGTLIAVLLYRLIGHWAVVPAGALAWLALTRSDRRHRSVTPVWSPR